MSDTPSSPNVIEAVELTKVFRDFWHRPKVQAVNGLSFEIRRGEIFGLLGPNGSGKSTTIKMILGLLHPTRGRLSVLGRSPRDVAVKARIGYLPEESYLYPYLTSEETLDFFGRLFDLSTAERRTRITQLLDMIGLGHARRRLVGEFSKGMARRIGLAQALINDPDLVILDEPTSGLDPLGCRQIKDLIVTLARRGKTVLLSSHLLADVEDICHRSGHPLQRPHPGPGHRGELLEQPGQSRIVLPAELPPETLRQVLASLREVLGREPEVDHPRKDLEQFFLEVVAKARAESAENTGASAGRSVAHYLDQPPPAPPPADVNQALAALVAPRAGDTSEIRNSTSEI
jgi:ABC-2 type transport system ATP-binding protein